VKAEVKPGAVEIPTADSVGRAPVSHTSNPRRILLAGEPRLYLQALSELLDSIPGVSSTLVPPGENGRSPGEHAPELILLGCPVTSDEPVQVSESLAEAYPGVPLVLLESGPVQDVAARTASLNATTRLSTRMTVGELVKQLCDPAKATMTGTRPHCSRSETRAEWPLSSLSERELSVLRLFVSGRSNDEIAETLGISRHTVRSHLQNVMTKMAVRSKTELVSVAMRSGVRAGTGPLTQAG